jgi:hypothetical protein
VSSLDHSTLHALTIAEKKDDEEVKDEPTAAA